MIARGFSAYLAELSARGERRIGRPLDAAARGARRLYVLPGPVPAIVCQRLDGSRQVRVQ